MSDYYDRRGKPIKRKEWHALYQGENKRVALTERGDVLVSTVWLGVDHRIGDGPPLIFETMVFGGPLSKHHVRYSTEAEALAGHAEICSAAFRSEQ